MFESTLSLNESELVLPLFGPQDAHLRAIREHLPVNITHRDGKLRVMGDEASVALATRILEQMKAKLQKHGSLTLDEVQRIVAQVTDQPDPGDRRAIDVVNVSKQVRPRTEGQARYVAQVREHSVVFAVGPAGTGKTYLAVAMAVEALKNRHIRKIVLVRPAVEAGESLGYLPGDLHAKINPYLRPLLDALNEMIDYDQVKRLMEQDVIEVIPLAYMRGRTLNEAFIILDEAQNTTVSQMKMFLTRMGEGSKIVVSGDATQLDLPPNTRSGLIDALKRLRNIQGVSEVVLSKSDIVRHRLVQEIVQAYEETHGSNEDQARSDRPTRR